MHNRRFLWAAEPPRALLEVFLLGVTFLLVIKALPGQVSRYVVVNSVFLMCAVCGTWAVLRIRLPRGGLFRHLWWEALVASGIGLVVAVGVQGVDLLFGRPVILEGSLFPDRFVVSVVLFLTGAGYLALRPFVRLWLWWDRLRKERMIWALTHAHLVVVAAAAFIGVLALFLITWRVQAPVEGAVAPLERVLSEVLTRIFPSLLVTLFFAVLALVVTLPPSALFSYLVARRTTRRLETLTRTTGALRKGDYGARVPVQGEDEVAQLQADFNAMAEELQRTLEALEAERDKVSRLLEARRELVATVSHELRTPIATLRGYLDSNQEGWDAGAAPPERLRRDLQRMDGEVARLQRLIEDLFTLSQAEVGGLTMDLRPADVGEVLRGRVDAFAPLAWTRGRVEVVAEVPENLPRVLADAGRLEQVLGNLLHNALRHTPPGGIVAVLACVEGETVRIDVRDTGEGIPAEELPRVWQRFYRGEGAQRRDAGGAGLGLALVKELVEGMGGSVSVESTVGEGSCFTVWLPTGDR